MINSTRILLLTGAATVSMGGLIAPALAQDAAAKVSNAGDEAAPAKGDIVVTAERRATKLQDTPISVSVLGGEALDQSTSSGLTEVLNSTPGVAATVNYQTGGTQLAVRGVSAAGPTFNGASTVAYYLDSIPFGLVRTAIGPDLNPYDLSRVEILRGPQGTLYGAGGLNGVVRVLTNDPDLSKFELKARGDASGTYHARGANYGGDAAINIPLVDDVLAIRGVIGIHHYAGWIDSVNSKGVNDAKVENYRVKVAFKPTDNFSTQLTFWRSANEYGAPSAGDSNYFNKGYLAQPMGNAYNSVGLKLAYQAEAFTVTSESAYLDYKSHAFTDLNPVGLQGFQGVTNLKSRVYTEQLDVTSKGKGPFSWSAGFFYRDAKDVTFQPFNTPTASLIFSNFSDGSKAWAVYGEVGYKFADDKLKLTGGLRYFHDASLSQALSASALGNVSLAPFRAKFNAVTPRAVLQWYPNSANSFYASYSQGFRSGVVQSEEVSLVAPSFPAASPDRLHNFEIGAKGKLGGVAEYTAAAFYIKWNGVQQIVSVPILAGSSLFTGALINGSSASGFGVEGSLYANLTDRLRVGGAASYNGLSFDADIVSSGVVLFYKGQRLNYSPAFTASASADYSFPVTDGGMMGAFSTSLNYTSSQETTTLRGVNRVVKAGDDMLLLNARVALNAPDKRWTFSIFANNLTNNNGTPIRAGSVTYFDSRIQPRTIGAAVEFHY